MSLRIKKVKRKTRAIFLKNGGFREWVIQAEIVAWLETTALFWWRQNSGTMFVRGRKVFLGPVGGADISIIGPDGRFNGLEIKTAVGRPSNDQIAYAARLTATGGRYFIARNLKQAMDAVAEMIGEANSKGNNESGY